MTRRNVHLPDDLWHQLEACAEQEGVSIAEIVRQILERSMKRRGK